VNDIAVEKPLHIKFGKGAAEIKISDLKKG
jgi:hypothetical protein